MCVCLIRIELGYFVIALPRETEKRPFPYKLLMINQPTLRRRHSNRNLPFILRTSQLAS